MCCLQSCVSHGKTEFLHVVIYICHFVHFLWALVKRKLEISWNFPCYEYGSLFVLEYVKWYKLDCLYFPFRGGYRKPTYTDVLWVQLVFFPYYLVMYIKWYIRWLWKFTIKREEYGEEEKLYLIRKYLKLSSSQFDVSWWSMYSW